MTELRPTDDCSCFERWLTPFVDGELDAVHTIEIEEHLDECESCRERVAFMRAMRGSLREEVRAKAPASLRARLEGVLAAQLAETEQSPSVTELERERRAASETSEAPQAVPSSPAPRVPTLVRGRYVFPLAAAAVLVIVLGAVHYKNASTDVAAARRIDPGIFTVPVSSAESVRSPVLANLEPLDQLVEDLVAQHAEPLPPETTDPQRLQSFDRFVGVRVPRPKFDDARYLGARVHPVARGNNKARAAMLQYMLRNRHRVTVYVFDPERVPMRANHLESRKVGQHRIYVGKLRGYSVAASSSQGVGYALASDLSDDESARLVVAAAR